MLAQKGRTCMTCDADHARTERPNVYGMRRRPCGHGKAERYKIIKYKRSSPGGSIGLACDRADQTALSRFVSGHLRSCSFSHGNKVFPVCAKCGVASASPEHILSCLRLSRETFETDPLLALDFLRVSGLMDGV
ncbi:hypothetical protein AVEN_199859-1 [Araneus ventricosus]|uniref:Uncharacterized protein n=1 Tax=Araneus ventricosus TaxID=182803 RepID=A0A4Y2DSG8_ARAVE|nr:hypothetical protein AVEN_199859-1 [Araneus ventricosus]